MFLITQNQWNKTSNDYKSVINGVKYIMGVADNCCLTPVEISEDGSEHGVYLFEEHGITYSVLAWNFEDAKRVIKKCGHRKTENLRLKPQS
jgi:hypothetical protein